MGRSDYRVVKRGPCTLIHHQPTINDNSLRASLYVPKLCPYVDSLKNGSGDETR